MPSCGHFQNIQQPSHGGTSQTIRTQYFYFEYDVLVSIISLYTSDWCESSLHHYVGIIQGFTNKVRRAPRRSGQQTVREEAIAAAASPPGRKAYWWRCLMVALE